MTCEACGGKCCALWDIDVVPCLDSVPDHLTKQDRRFGDTIMRQRNGACIALKDGRCSIYEDRPKVCRDFQQGGSDCLFRQTMPWSQLLRKVRRVDAPQGLEHRT